jgi:hypothetical protein
MMPRLLPIRSPGDLTRLRDHPGIMDRWPPHPGGVYSKSRAAPANCLDVLEGSSYLRSLGSTFSGIALATNFEGEHYIRDLYVRDNRFAIVLCRFLKKQMGKTILRIGETDVDFK